VLDLRHRCRYLRAVVPDYAKSAATLLMFGVDKIFMAPAAELGPLDAQIEHPTKEGLIVSALDVADSLESLGRTSMDLAISSGATVVRYTGLPRLEVLEAVLQYMARFLHPAIEKLDPHLIHQATNQLKIAERYARIMLELRNLPEEEQISPEAATDLVNRLVNDYPTHGFVISRNEARALGLPVEKAESHPRWDKIQEIYEQFLEGKQPFIRIIRDESLDGHEEAEANEGGADEQATHETDEDAEVEVPSLSSR
jgi:hypothetical protein